MASFIARLSTIAVLALAAVPAVGLSQAEAAPRTARPAPLASIRVGDLDLSRTEDARIFKARIDAAGEAVCAARIRQESLDRWSARACRMDVQDEVRSRLSRPQLRALRSAGG
ncbi:UrcA family protein [Caulobacter sp. LARHSG274]